jgi:hypothetical protein
MTTNEQTIPITQVAGMRYYQRHDGIHVYSFTDSRRETVDALLAQGRKNDLDAHSKNEHMRALVDGRGVWMTPYAIASLLKSAQHTPPGLKESTAVVLNDNFMTGVLIGVLHKLPRSVQANVHLFTSEADALTWLDMRKEQLHDHA